MKKLTTAFIAFFTAFSVNAQMAVFKKELTKPTELTYYALNHLGDTSSILNNEIEKENILKTYTFKDPFLGAIEMYDERNPLQQLVFYKNTQNIVLLDNQLSVKEKISLFDRYPEIDAVYAALSSQSSIWIFDQTTQRWGLISSNQNQPNYISNPITVYDFITTSGNFAYWQVKNMVYGIDIYGNVLEQQKLPSRAQLLAVNGDYYVYKLNSGIFLLDRSKKETQRLREIQADVAQVIMVAKNISLVAANKLYLYTLN
ncbi:hypothetical protein [Paenimyroides viscosum]|uniref:Uncharacterized protein n=1 Tax=Paenimyroides viscosum TaxID=2488729 RepID=A0A3P1B1K3_9FLAO|nr:hypothetical protein [Paenimyroides viscosum]RRA94871.1 hypothetical protein EG242_07575 [Paenimyroides viscosum]